VASFLLVFHVLNKRTATMLQIQTWQAGTEMPSPNQRDLPLYFVFYLTKRFVSTDDSHACSATPGSRSSKSNDADSFMEQKKSLHTEELRKIMWQ